MILPKVDSSAFIALAACVVITWVLRVSKKRYPSTQAFRQGLLLGHTLYILYLIFVTPPRNVFTETASSSKRATDSLRSLYSSRYPNGVRDGELDRLFRRLNSFDMRVMYFQLGHDAVAGCDYCNTHEEFISFSLARPLFAYVLEIALVGAFTLPGSSRAHLRSFGMALLIISLVAEVLVTLTTGHLLVPGALDDWWTTHWHDCIHLARSVIFLAIPLMIRGPRIPYIRQIPILSAFLPAPDTRGNRQRTAERLQALQQTLDKLVPRLHLISYARAAIMRNEETRERAAKWWSVEAKEGKAVLEDETFQRTAKQVGMGYMGEDGAPLRDNARKGLDAIFNTVPPSQHWVQLEGSGPSAPSDRKQR